MTNFDEMLAALHGDSKGDALSDVVGADKAPKITVTAARDFKFDEGFDKVIAYEGDVNSQIITFILPELHEGHSLSECGNKKVRWINQASKVEGTSVLTPGAEVNEYEWNVPPALFAKSGTIEFSIVVYDLDADDKIGFSWNTAPCTALSVGKSIESVGGIGNMPAQNEILIIDEDSKTIIAPVGYNTIIANSGDKNTSVVYFQTKRYIKGIDLTAHTAAAPVVHISYVLDDGGKRSTGSGSIEVIPYTSQYDGITNELVLIIWRPEAGLTADSLFYGSFQILVSFKKGEKVWNSAPYKELRIGKPLDYTDNPGGTFTPQPSYKFLGRDYSNKGDIVEIGAIIAHQVHTEAEWRELEYVPEKGEVVYVISRDGSPMQRIGDGINSVLDLPTLELLQRGLGKYGIQMPGSVSGAMGYYYSAIDLNNKKIYLSKTRTSVPEIITDGSDRTDTINFTEIEAGYRSGGRICIVNSNQYNYDYNKCTATVESISYNVVTYNGDLGFTEIIPKEEKDWTSDDYTFFVMNDNQWSIGSIPVKLGGVAFGIESRAHGNYSFAAGENAVALGNNSIAFGRRTIATHSSFAEGEGSRATGLRSHAQNYGTRAIGDYSSAGGYGAQALGEASRADGWMTIAEGRFAFSIGREAQAIGIASVALGEGSIAKGNHSFAGGRLAKTQDILTELNTGRGAFAFGDEVVADGNYSVALNVQTKATRIGSVALGYQTSAEAPYAIALGNITIARGQSSFAHGLGTIAVMDRQFVIGQYNQENGEDPFVIGWGLKKEEPITIHTVDRNGNGWYRGNLYVTGKDKSAGQKVATEKFVKDQIEQLKGTAPGVYDTLTKISTELAKDNNVEIEIINRLGAAEANIGNLRTEFLKAGNLPTVTTADNGKFLQVVNGIWAAVTIPQAEGGSF